MSNLSNSLSLNYFTAQQRGESYLWQLELAELGFSDRIADIEIAADKSLHRLPFKHCGKPTDTTSHLDVVRLSK